MAGVTAYTGTQGSGKSYEVVANVILPAVAAGRRVVTNVAGLQLLEIYAYCRDVLRAERVGEIVPVTNNDVERVEFFPVEESDPLFGKFESVVKGGDVVILDEVWRWYSSGTMMPMAHMKFIRMHRHFTDPKTGVTCDIVLIVQSIGDLQRKVKAVVEKTFVMHKHKDLGFPNRYVVNIYTGSRVHKSNLAQDPIQGEYRPEIYNLYKSHSQSKAVRVNEVDADKRGSVFQSWRFRLLLPLAVVMVLASFWFMWRFFHPAPKASQSSESGDVRGADVRPEAPDVQSERPKQALENLRVIGSFTTSTDRVFLVVDELGRVRKMVNPVFAEVSQYQTRVMLPNGEYASTWFSGPEARASEDKGGRDVARAR